MDGEIDTILNVHLMMVGVVHKVDGITMKPKPWKHGIKGVGRSRMIINVYMIAHVMGNYMIPYSNKVYKDKNKAEEQCAIANEKCQNQYEVLCANNWHKVEGADK